jgi:hypothetical protein
VGSRALGSLPLALCWIPAAVRVEAVGGVVLPDDEAAVGGPAILFVYSRWSSFSSRACGPRVLFLSMILLLSLLKEQQRKTKSERPSNNQRETFRKVKE